MSNRMNRLLTTNSALAVFGFFAVLAGIGGMFIQADLHEDELVSLSVDHMEREDTLNEKLGEAELSNAVLKKKNEELRELLGDEPEKEKLRYESYDPYQGEYVCNPIAGQFWKVKGLGIVRIESAADGLVEYEQTVRKWDTFYGSKTEDLNSFCMNVAPNGLMKRPLVEWR